VEKYQEGKYRCRVVFKGCAALSQPASLTVLEDDEIIRCLHQQCLNVEETTGDAAVAEFLEKYGNTGRLAKKALVSALQCETELPHLIQSFTRREVPVNFLQDGMSPLHWACVRGHWRMVQHLLSCGASKTTLTQEGRNAVHLVCERGDNNSLQFLIHTGAEELVNVQDKHGKTPLHLACEAAQKIVPSKLISHDMRDIKTVIQNLLSHNTSLRAADENGQTPLHMAAIAGHPWIVEVVLLCNTAGLNDQDHEQNTPLHYASSLNWSEVVISLLERGANETIEDKDHMTPLAVAEAKGHTDVANILKRKPGTVKRDRKHTVYVTEQRARPRSANIEIDPISSPMQSSRLLKSPSVEKSAPQRRSAHLPQQTPLDSPGRFFSSSALLKLFHHNSTEKKECTAQSQQEATLMSGYLQKMEGKKWSRLWGQLQHDSTLYLYKAQEDSCATSSLALVGFKVEPVPSSMTIHLLHPKGKSKHNCVFKLDNEPEFTQWVEMLEKTVGGDLLPPLQPDVLFSPLSPHSDLSPP
jgi:ankyrin repeat protein